MVKNKKSLFIFIILFSLINNFAYSQQNENENLSETVVEQEQNDFENNLNYFNDSGSDSNLSNQSNKQSNAKMIFKMILVLILVIAALYSIMYFFKKKNNNTKSDDDFLRRVSSLNLSPGKSIEIVTLVDKGFILGVTDNNINLIAQIDDKEMISALNLNFDKKQNTKKPMNFSDVLDMFMPNNSKNNKNIFSEAEQRIDNISSNNISEEENKE